MAFCCKEFVTRLLLLPLLHHVRGHYQGRPISNFV
jgi:hypothetical protein